MTLKLSDFKEVILRPKEIALGTFLQFFIMPLLGFLLAKIFRLSPELAAGVILLGSCPGGTASNVSRLPCKRGCCIVGSAFRPF